MQRGRAHPLLQPLRVLLVVVAETVDVLVAAAGARKRETLVPDAAGKAAGLPMPASVAAVTQT
jgi:hypothetical protein